MKAVFGALALLVVVGAVGVVVVRQTRALSSSRAVLPAPQTPATDAMPTSRPAAEQKIRRELDDAMQAASSARAQAGEP